MQAQWSRAQVADHLCGDFRHVSLSVVLERGCARIWRRPDEHSYSMDSKRGLPFSVRPFARLLGGDRLSSCAAHDFLDSLSAAFQHGVGDATSVQADRAA